MDKKRFLAYCAANNYDPQEVEDGVYVVTATNGVSMAFNVTSVTEDSIRKSGHAVGVRFTKVPPEAPKRTRAPKVEEKPEKLTLGESTNILIKKDKDSTVG